MNRGQQDIERVKGLLGTGWGIARAGLGLLLAAGLCLCAAVTGWALLAPYF
mgnify:CR=1 FL=1